MMKIQSLMLTLALAAGGTAFAAVPNGTGTAPAYPATAAATRTTSTTTVSKDTLGDKMEAGAHKTKRAAKRVHAKARHGAHHMHASAKHGTHAMGAGTMAPSNDTDTSSRQARIDQAYANWKAKPGS